MSGQGGKQQAPARRILLALDPMNCESALIEAAALIAAKLQAELDVLFVENADVYAVADLPITQEISLSSAREREISGHHVEQALRCLSRDAEQRFSKVIGRSRVKGRFNITRARRGDALDEMSANVELLMLQPAERTIVRVRIQQAKAPRVFAVVGATAASARALELAANLALHDHHVLEVVGRGDIDPAPLAEMQRQGLQVNLHPHQAGADIVDLLRDVENRLGNTLLVAGDLATARDHRRLLEELSHLRCQVLLVN